MSEQRVPRVARIVSHPTQFDVPFYRMVERSREMDLSVYYWRGVELGLLVDPELGHPPGWDFDITHGYRWAVIPGGRAKQWRTLRSEIFSPGRFDLVLISGWGAGVARMAIAQALISSVPSVIISDATLLYTSPTWRQFVKKALMKASLPFFPAFAATGSLARGHLLHFGVPEDRIFLLPYTVDIEWLERECTQARERRIQIREAMKIPKHAMVLLAVAKFVPREGVSEILKAYERVLDEGERPALLLVGDGSQREELVRFVEQRRLPNVVFGGYQPYSELPKFYAIADVFIHAAREEPWGVSVNEAMACGLPVIASDRVGAAHDLIVQGENGFMYPAADENALTSAIARILSQSVQRRAEMGHRSRQLIGPWTYAKTMQELHRILAFFARRQS